jgi:hypothetical protein
MPQNARIVDQTITLSGPLERTRIVYYALTHEYPITKVIVERRNPRRMLLAGRLKRLGARKAIGQVLSWLVVPLVIEAALRARISSPQKAQRVGDPPIDEAKGTRVESVNAKGVIDLLREFLLSVVVNRASIIATKVLGSIPTPSINVHDGVTALYRGDRGAYLPLIEGNRSACGIPVHLAEVDVHTGGILLAQATTDSSPYGRLAPHPCLLLSAELPLLEGTLRDAIGGCLWVLPLAERRSHLRNHPTLGECLRAPRASQRKVS